MSKGFNFAFEQNTNSSGDLKKENKQINFNDYIVRAIDEFQDTSPILLQGDVPLFNSGEISLITGEPKTKKTFLVSYIIAVLLAKNKYSEFTSKLQNGILLIDTEQGRRRTNSVVRRIYRMLNRDFSVPISNFTAISIRELSANERFLILEKAIRELPFSIVFLDGFADLIQNTNDLEECSRKVSELMRLSEDYNTHICCVVHTNPQSEKTRGHVGSELQRKCETVLLVKKDGEISTVSPQFCRNKEFEKFSFFVNPYGLPETCELPTLGIQALQTFAPFFDVLSEISYTDLCDMLVKKEKIVKRTAERKIKQAFEIDILKKNDNGNYSLNKP